MYHPYFRGKQYELITIRENARLLKESGFIPVIEPVKEAMNVLKRTIDEIRITGGECIVIINPNHGDYINDDRTLYSFLMERYSDFPGLAAGILLTEDTSVEKVNELCRRLQNRQVTLVHSGFNNGKALAQALPEFQNVTRHIFVDGCCGKLYRKNFQHGTRVLIRDGFQKRINRAHPSLERFSDLHATFREEGMDGFGDFLMVGDDYSESGGPAYAVAIHLTYIDFNGDGEMYIRHFVSNRTETPSDPGGKFLEALSKLVEAVEKDDSQIIRTQAVNEYLGLYRDGHYPGLGYVKKLSMQHHIETFADYFAKN
jgi:hypothetical protein